MKRPQVIFILICVLFVSISIYGPNKGRVSNSDGFKLVVVPGHEPSDGGAHYGDLYERDMNVELAERVAELMRSKDGYSVFVSRTRVSWNPLMLEYFDANRKDILDFKNRSQNLYRLFQSAGLITKVEDRMPHAEINDESAVKLYGLNRWANENEADLLIHVHFNDSSRRDPSLPGKNRGFTIFVPESQLKNSLASKAAATFIYAALEKRFDPQGSSGYRLGLLEDQSLIALGAFDTLESPSVLIEYAYIYEGILGSPEMREKTLSAMAEATLEGIEDYRQTFKSK